MNVQYKNKKYQTENNNNKNIPIDEKKNLLELKPGRHPVEELRMGVE